MHCQGIACISSFDLGLLSADGQKLECFKWTTNNICESTMIISKPITNNICESTMIISKPITNNICESTMIISKAIIKLSHASYNIWN